MLHGLELQNYGNWSIVLEQMFAFVDLHLDRAATPPNAAPTPAPNNAPPPTLPPTLPAACDTEVEQQSNLCQNICGCDCSAGGQGQVCQQVCGLPNGVQSLPWCQGGGPSPTTPSPNNAPPTTPPPAILKTQLSRQELRPGRAAALDGSPAIFYYRPPPAEADGTKWVIYLKGGGGCQTNQQCNGRALGTLGLGSSKDRVNLRTNIYAGPWASEDQTENPGFFDAHKVYVPYITGDYHTGTREENYTFPFDPTWNTAALGPQPQFRFSGHVNLEEIVDQLNTNASFTAIGGGIMAATDVLLMGCSAGAMGARTNADWLKDTLPETVNYKVASIAGITRGTQSFANFNAGVPGWTPPSPPDHVPDFSSVVLPWTEPACLQAGLDAGRSDPEARAYCATNLATTVRTKIMWIEAQFDYQPIEAQNNGEFTDADYNTVDGQRYLVQWGRDTRQWLYDHADFVFSPSCITHCPSINNHVSVEGVTSLALLNDWFFEINSTSHKRIDGMTVDGVHQPLNDGLPSNPTCEQPLPRQVIANLLSNSGTCERESTTSFCWGVRKCWGRDSDRLGPL